MRPPLEPASRVRRSRSAAHCVGAGAGIASGCARIGSSRMAESLAVHVKTYCTLSTLSAEAEAALGSILASLQGGAGDGGKLSLLQLIDSSQEVLTSTDDGVRNRGIMMLGEVLTRQPALVQGQSPTAFASLLNFFAARLQDEPCVREVLRSARSVTDEIHPGAGPEVEGALAALATGVFEHVHVQALSLTDRNNAYNIVQSAIVRLALSSALLGDNVVMAFVGIMDGERDPRNLRLCFSIIPTLAERFLSSTSDAEALFTVFSCYFPITFTPPPNDTVGITTEMLRDGLLECMTCHLLMATQALDLAQGKLASADPAQTRLDSLDVIAALASRFGIERSMGVRGVRQVWSMIRLQIVDSSEVEVQARARSCLRHLIRLAAEEQEAANQGQKEEETGPSTADSDRVGVGAGAGAGGVDDLLAGTPMEHLVKQLKTQCMVDVKRPEEARARRGASALMCAISAHELAAAHVLGETLTALCDIVMTPAKGTAAAPLVRQQAALECLLQAVMSARALWAYMRKEGRAGGDKEHALAPHARMVFECVASVVQYPVCAVCVLYLPLSLSLARALSLFLFSPSLFFLSLPPSFGTKGGLHRSHQTVHTQINIHTHTHTHTHTCVCVCVCMY
jgi:hypothetical protein